MSTSMTKTDCGCGGSGTGDCGCGCGGGAEICTDLNFKRPRFFAGQLLTEDDLQALTDYVVGKNRLHNRFLFGDGVVCGLSVTCHPCGDGKVVVAPGFALDCCGNDILVPCKEELDIKALLRDLRKRQLAGYDCGDPCDEKNGDIRTYGLYINYTEKLEDPVAPYASGDPCGQQACEPTRVCEGYKFELRCDCELPDRIDLFKRVAACFGDVTRSAAAVSKAQTADVQASRILGASRVIEAEAAVPFGKNSIAILENTTAEMDELNKISIDEDLDEDGAPKLKPDEKALRLNVAHLQLLTGAVTRFRALPEEEQKTVLGDNAGLSELLKSAESSVAEAGPRIKVLASKVLKTPTARIEAEDSVRMANKYVLEDLPEGGFETFEAKMVALNTPISYRQASRLQTDAALLKEWLLDKLADSASLTRCDLYERLRRVRIEPTGEEAISELHTAGATSRAVKELLQIMIEYLIDCICLALNPPCQPCEDQGVLLACVKVRDCEVVDICNMSRRFVLTPVALRYWLPPIGIIGDLLKKFCCDFDIGKLFGGKEREPVDRVPGTVPQFINAGPREMPIVASYAPTLSTASLDEDTALVLQKMNFEPAKVEAVTMFSSNLALLSARAAAIDPAVLADSGKRVSSFFDRDFQRDDPQVTDESNAERDKLIRLRVAEEVDKEISEARKEIERNLEAGLDKSVDASAVRLRADLEKVLSKDIGAELGKKVAGDVKSVVAKELSVTNLRRAITSSDAVKKLKDENTRLNRELTKLSKTVEGLQKRGDA